MQRTKKILLGPLILAVSMLACIGTGCEATANEQPYTHNYGTEAVSIITPSTCSEKGKGLWRCKDCGEEIIRDIPEKAHTIAIDKAISPTCTSGGMMKGEHCSVCGEILVPQQSVPRLTHDFDNEGVCRDCGTEKSPTTITFMVDGVQIGETHYHADLEPTIPEVPERVGYAGKWENCEIDYTDRTATAVYEPIVYNIVYHVVSISTKDGVKTPKVDYNGTWEEYWRPKSSYLDEKTLITEYTIESEDLTLATAINREISLASKYSVYLAKIYTDEMCTQAFSGVIPKGSTGDVHLYIQHTASYFGPY